MGRLSKPRRRSLRLPTFDYSQSGAYFVTICSIKKKCIFGAIIDMEMQLNENGKIVGASWKEIEKHFPTVKLDQFIVMPNHLHGIIILQPACPEVGIKAVSLSTIIGLFKSNSAKRINELRGTTGAGVWQRSFYEHIIRNQESLDEIRQYIANNPYNWPQDPENPIQV